MNKLSVTIIAVGLVVSACAARTEGQVATTAEPGTPEEREAPVETDRVPPSPVIAIAPNPGFEVEGEAGVQELEEGRTGVSIEIRGAASNAMLPWHVHEGACGSGGAIVGDPTIYPPLAAGLDGSASVETTIDMTLDPAADYHINIHKSPSEMEAIVACGELNQN